MKINFDKRNSFFSFLQVLAISLVSLLGFSTPATAAVPTPDDVFTFDNSLSSSTSGVILSPYANCSGTPSAPCNTSSVFGSTGGDGYWEWASSSTTYGGGFSYSPPLTVGSSYTFFLKFQIITSSTGDSYNKLVDYNNLADDNGFYLGKTNGNWVLVFYPLDEGETNYSVTQLLDLAVVRDGSVTPATFSVYTRSSSGAFTEEYQIPDPTGLSIPAIVSGNTILGFFGEDGNSAEALQAGKVYDFRFWHNTALSEAQLNEQFAAIYTVTYDINGATSGSAPSSTTASGAQVVSGNTGGLQKTGHTFAGWNTQIDGRGVTHSAAGTITPASSITLFAMWTPIPPAASLPATGVNESSHGLFATSSALVLLGLLTILISRRTTREI